MPITFIIFAVITIGFTLAMLYTDTMMHRIPNVLTIPLAITGFAFHTVTWLLGQPLFDMDPSWSLAGLVVGFLYLFLPYLLGGSGAGDVKLLAAMGACWGISFGFGVFAVSMVIAAILSMIIIIIRKMIGVSQKQNPMKSKEDREKAKAERERLHRNSSGETNLKKRYKYVPKRALPYTFPVFAANIIQLCYVYIQHII